mmetsp:Transcript_18015/g.26796  ORF Transcript_18015/g.26796 Transcript_18015/m.26796 type:complete len:106 (-) Transcript_18015:180-497(-)|eukprot:CAMPEP_0116051288 /NCGR_PEP_ID=MMETSP0322-20121206/894_1 /TAXON_ID=163516 /ORGANISM="Leptocylindrus danicus var. apora, Strain B651" /LENGTH=105 /DNA_ID=CAMNT_0003534015 /DNA_START=68 /DNA_END=385 /DNA_ORIENTATION=+
MVKFVKNLADFDALMAQSKEKLVVVDFTASWCGPCQMVAPHFEQMAADNPNVIFVKVDVDDADDVSSKCGIRCMPTFHFYKDGKKVESMEGANLDKLKELVAKLG